LITIIDVDQPRVVII